MRVQIVMDRSGDTRQTFNPEDATSLAHAEQRFRELTGKGFRAVVLGKEGEPGKLLHAFDPKAKETLFIPQLQGG